jgi:16S rRNA (cytosine967-C5)-methyltransferase
VSAQKPREIAVRVLLKRTEGAEYVEDLLDDAAATAGFSPADRGLCQELTYGVVRWQDTLDWLISQRTEGRKQKAALQVILRLGLYQIFWLDRIPNHAAVHETVELAKQFGLGPQSGFVNALLRGFVREQDEVRKLIANLKMTQPAIGYSHPAWLARRWTDRWGAIAAVQLFEFNNTPPPTFARVNTLKTDVHRLATHWEREGVKFAHRSWDWTGEGLVFQLESHPPLATLKSFKHGHFYVQDPSTLLAVHELDPQPGEIILDLCAAPGGKTTFIAQRMENRGRITAQDSQPDRLPLIQENCERLGLTCVESSVAPASFIAKPSLRFDRILVDAPCSNTGVLRRRVDLRWRIQPEEIERLHAAQVEILRLAAPRLKPGGRLVYSTCSLEPEENKEVVLEFLAQHPDFAPLHDRELRPFADGVDGAYVSVLRRMSVPPKPH